MQIPLPILLQRFCSDFQARSLRLVGEEAVLRERERARETSQFRLAVRLIALSIYDVSTDSMRKRKLPVSTSSFGWVPSRHLETNHVFGCSWGGGGVPAGDRN